MKRFTFSLLFSLSLLMVVGSNDYNRLYGDVNGDKKANITDVTDLINYLLTGEMAGPEAIHSPNMTIAEFKAKHWQDARNYVDTVTENEVIHGWVTSSDQSGNIYKTLYITDESGAGLTISVNQSDMYFDYPIGQEIVLPMQGYYVGKYNGQQVLGYPEWYAPIGSWDATFMPQSLWESLVELNGWPDPERAEVQPVTVNMSDFAEKYDAETQLSYQSKLVRLEGVQFVDADGHTTYSEQSSGTRRVIKDKDGNLLGVYTTNFANFASLPLPTGKVDVVGLLSTRGYVWQLMLRDINDVTPHEGDPDPDPEPITVTSLDEGFDYELPDTWKNIAVSGDKKWYQNAFNENGYAAMTGYKGTQPPFDAWLVTPRLDIQNAESKTLSFRTQVRAYGSTTSMLEVYLMDSFDPTKATVKVKLDPILAVAPEITYSDWTASGDIDLSQWADGAYFIGFRYYATTDANYATWCVDDVKFGIKVADENRADLETMGNPTGNYVSLTSAKGWVAENSALLSGGENDANPIFTFIGYVNGSTTEYAKAPTLNGKTTAVGTLVSPVLHGGMNRLCFNYGAAFTDNVLSFRVDVKQNGEVVKTWTVTNENVTKHEVYPFDEVCSIDGDFTIEFTNLCPSNATSNKNRVSIWNITWSADE